MFSAPYTPVVLRLTRPCRCQKRCALSSNVPIKFTPWQSSEGEKAPPHKVWGRVAAPCVTGALLTLQPSYSRG